jgi:gamma-glutamyltranspeptidase/glutathione hydrolase
MTTRRLSPAAFARSSSPANSSSPADSAIEETCETSIASIYKSFGSGIACPRTGVCLQNRAAGFNLRKGHPNCLAPGKRPLHTIMPGMALMDGRPVLAFGTVGGDFQPTGNTLLLTNLIDYGLDPQGAIDLPRIFPYGGEVKAERGIEKAVLDRLKAMGHPIVPAPLPLGSAQVITINWETGVLSAGSDGRTDDCAIGY